MIRLTFEARATLLFLAVVFVGRTAIPATVRATDPPAAMAASMAWPDSVTQFVMRVRATIRTTDMAGYRAAVTAPDGAMLLDVREASEFAAGHVPGAVNISRGLLEFRIWAQLGHPAPVDMNRRIYVQCQTGGRATLATRQLQDIGFTNVVAVIMNFDEWRRQGHPVV